MAGRLWKVYFLPLRENGPSTYEVPPLKYISCDTMHHALRRGQSYTSSSWSDINSLVKNVIGEVEDISEDLEGIQDEFQEHAIGFVGVTVTLSLLSALAFLLLCLCAMRIRKKLGRP